MIETLTVSYTQSLHDGAYSWTATELRLGPMDARLIRVAGRFTFGAEPSEDRSEHPIDAHEAAELIDRFAESPGRKAHLLAVLEASLDREGGLTC